jgi:group I intron endonuclease
MNRDLLINKGENIMQGIYKITNTINGKIYIGKTNDSDRRWGDHQRLAFTENHKEYNKSLYQAMRKYGIENFSFEMIEEIKDYKNQSGEREKYWISYFNSYYHGYNENLGGDGGSEPGHCKGALNGRAQLTEDDVRYIRQKYKEGNARGDIYTLFQDKISESGFGRVWRGETWKDIMPEVFTEENKKRNEKLGKQKGGLLKRTLTEAEIKEIRQDFSKGKQLKEIHEKYKDKVSLSTIADIVYLKTYKEITV